MPPLSPPPEILTAVTWGAPGSTTATEFAAELGNVIAVRANDFAFAAITADRRVVGWGDPGAGGDIHPETEAGLYEVHSIAATDKAFAAVRLDSHVVAWGDAGYGGDASAVANQLHGVASVHGNDVAFTAIKENGAIVSWGHASTGAAFAALHQDGALTVWGSALKGGNMDWPTAGTAVALADASVDAVYSTKYAFAAKLSDDRVLWWGDGNAGGLIPGNLNNQIADAGGPLMIASTMQAFAVLTTNGNVFAWGDMHFGGSTEAPTNVNAELNNAVGLYSTQYAFAARVCPNGDEASCGVVAWGDKNAGGEIPANKKALLNNVVDVYSNEVAFAAKVCPTPETCTIVTWGDEDAGGDSSAVSSDLVNVQDVFASGSAFTAMCRGA